MSFVDSVEKTHEQVIAEEGISKGSLPEAIQKRIRGWNLLLGRLNKYPDDEKLYLTLNKQSVEIADMIQDFIEQDYSEEGQEDEEEEGNTSNSKSDAPKNTKVKESSQQVSATTSKPKDSETTNTPKPFGNLVMEKKIRDIVNKNGNSRISQRELEAIIGKEPNYPEQKVHSITLRKVFLASDYRLL